MDDVRVDQVRRDVVVVGASAGGVEALTSFAGALPGDLDATVLVVLHIPQESPSALAHILGRHTSLPTSTASDGEELGSPRVLVAAPGLHLTVEDGLIRSRTGPRENGHRPSIDALFRSAAYSLGQRVIAVVLSGTRDDGTAGAAAVRAHGGVVMAQDPADALHPAMPRAVIERVGADVVGEPGKLAIAVAEYTRTPVRPQEGPDGVMADDDMLTANPLPGGADVGPPSGFMCPDCQGSLFMAGTDPVRRFRCRVGHAWSADSLVQQQEISVEDALWTAMRTLQEKAELCDQLAVDAGEKGHQHSQGYFTDRARDASASAERIHGMIDAVVPKEPINLDVEPANR